MLESHELPFSDLILKHFPKVLRDQMLIDSSGPTLWAAS